MTETNFAHQRIYDLLMKNWDFFKGEGADGQIHFGTLMEARKALKDLLWEVIKANPAPCRKKGQ